MLRKTGIAGWLFFFLFGNDTPFLTRRHPAPDPKWRSVRMNKKMSYGVRARDGPSAPARGAVRGWGCQSGGGGGGGAAPRVAVRE